MYEYVKVEDFTKNGKCSDCGKCCSNMLPLSVEEIKRIKAYVKRQGIKEQRHNFVSGFDMTCPFRDEANRKCTIYDIRPEICRQFKCNNTIEDIKKNKMTLHKKYDVVLMRNEFFGNKEDLTFAILGAEMTRRALRGEYHSGR